MAKSVISFCSCIGLIACIQQSFGQSARCLVPDRRHTIFTNVATALKVPQSTYVESGTSIRLGCETGYRVYGRRPRVSRCKRGIWTPQIQLCLQAPCFIPTGVDYEKATYRYRYGDDLRHFRPGKFVLPGREIYIVCKNDIEGDAVMEYHFSTCRYGAWGPELPSCTEGYRTCGMPNVIEGAVHNLTSVPAAEGTIISYECTNAYHVILGDSSRRCASSRWTPVQFTCEFTEPLPTRKRIIADDTENNHKVTDFISTYQELPVTQAQSKCSELTLRNGILYEVAGASEQRYRVECNRGYTSTVAQNTVQCRNSEWFPKVPVCKAVQCKSLEDEYTVLRPGLASETGYTEGMTVKITCRERYLPKYNISEATCVSGKWRRTHPVCRVSCSVPRTLIATYKYKRTRSVLEQGAEVPHGRYVVQKCRFRLSPSAKCDNGTWTPKFPRCFSGRSAAECIVPAGEESVFNMLNAEHIASGQTLANGTVVQKICWNQENSSNAEQAEVHTEPQGNINVCVNGAWLRDFPLCKKQNCLLPVTDDTDTAYFNEAGSFDYIPQDQDIEHGMTVQKYCYPGYKTNITANTVAVCDNGQWNVTFSLCVPENCVIPFQEEANMTLYFNMNKLEVLVPGDDVAHGDHVQINCTEDFHSSKTLTKGSRCDGGHFLPGLPECISDSRIYYCNPPNITNLVYEDTKPFYRIWATVRIRGCANNLTPAGSKRLVCLPDGEWFGNVQCLPYCQNGEESAVTTRYAYSKRARPFKKTFGGVVRTWEECFHACQEMDKILCRSIQVIERKNTNSNICWLIGASTNMYPRFFIKKRHSISRVIDRMCDDQCTVPQTNDNERLENKAGYSQRAGKSEKNGAVLHVACLNGLTPRIPYIVCVGGEWNKNGPYCVET